MLTDTDGYAGALPLGDCTNRMAVTADFGEMINMQITIAFEAIEGGVLGENTFLAQDLRGYLRYFGSLMPFAQSVAETIGLPFTKGGSSGIQTTFEAYSGNSHALRLREKPRMVTMGIRASLTTFRDDDDRARLVVQLPVISGYGGVPIGGRHAAQILFDGAPKQIWQQCLFAAALGKNLLLSQSPTLEDGKRSSINRAVIRAEACIEEISPDTATAQVQIATLGLWVVPQVPAPDALDPAIRRHARAEARLAHIDEVAQTIVLTASREAQSVLMAAGDISAGTGAMKPITDALPADACLDGSCAAQVGFAFAAAEIVDERLIPTAVRTNVTGALFGNLRPSEGGFKRVAPAMGQASLHKITHLLVAAANNVQSLCSKWRGGKLKDFDGFAGVKDCDDAFGPPERRSVSDAIQWSANLGFAHLVDRFPEDFEDLHKNLGWLGEMTGEASIGATLGLGVMPAGPADFMQLLGAIETGTMSPLSMLDAPRATGNGHVYDMAAMGFDDAALRRVRSWLGEPIAGTLKGTVDRVNWPKGCSKPHMGKTGTNFANEKRLSKNMVMIVNCDGRKIVLYGGVWTQDLANGSVGRVSHSTLAPMIEATLRAALLNTPSE